MKPQIPWLRVFVEGVVIVGSILLAFGIDEFDVTPDGEFLFVRRLELGAPGNLVLVQNFFEVLRQRVPN